jgi:hypothetical protein
MKTIEKIEPIKKEKQIITYPIIKIHNSPSVKIRKIERTDDYLRIDFINHAGKEYVNGGWVRIEPNTFIRPQGTSFRLPLIKAKGAPLAPDKHYYKSQNDRLFYSLYFPAISKTVEFIDIIEKEGGDDSYFNFYGVSVQRILKSPIVIQGIYYSLCDN